MPDMKVTLPLSRLMDVSKRLGSQNVDMCPTSDAPCWGERELKGYFEGDPIENACAECWMHWFTTGT